jgi:hypothetical protein
MDLRTAKIRVARLFMVKCTKKGEIYTKMVTKYQMAIKIPNDNQIHQNFSSQVISTNTEIAPFGNEKYHLATRAKT